METYPFAKKWSEHTVQELFENLMKHETIKTELKIENIKDRLPYKYRMAFEDGVAFLTIDSNLDEYVHINIISDFFTEDVRLVTSKRKFMEETPMEMWKKYSDEIIKIAFREYGQTDLFHVRQAAFKFTKESNNFRPTIALSVYQNFFPKSILDISAGWGDRLIAALAYATTMDSGYFMRYVGFDPNINLQKGYKEIINTFLPSDMKSSQFKVFPEPFENSLEILTKLGAKFDFIFSSIPYFDFEEYDIGSQASGGKRNQSIQKYNTIDKWIHSFLIPSIRICSLFMTKQGYLAINMEGYFVTRFLQKYDRVFEEESLSYEGIMGYVSDNPKDQRVHPIYIWRKDN